MKDMSEAQLKTHKKANGIPGTLVDAFEMARKHPDSFEAPSLDEIDAVEAGDMVKICVEPDDLPGERFWLMVTETDGVGEDKTITGTVANHLMFVDLDFGQEVTVNAKNLYAIELQ